MNNLDKLKMQTKNIADENIEYIAKKFPNAVTETLDKSGNVVKKINFENLKQELSTEILEDNKESYMLTWPGKKQSVVLTNTSISETLRPIKGKSSNFDGTRNIYIEGDNLDALKLLRETYLEKIKIIYIDPPYNTGNDFVYRDNFSEAKEEYLEKSKQISDEGYQLLHNVQSDGRFHSNWLSMMYARLKIAKDLLSDDGIIFISIDDNEQANLNKICDEIFGETNFVGTYIKQSKIGGGSDSKFIVREHEYVSIYAKNAFSADEMFIEHDAEYLKRYKEADERGRYFWDTLARPGLKNPIYYDIVAPDGTVMNYGWIHSKERFEQELRNGLARIVKKRDGTWSVQFKQYLNDSGKKPRSMTMNFGGSIDGKNDLIEIFNNSKIFSYPKSVKFIKTLLASVMGQDMIVMDFFSGSATTAQAVMQLNAEDGGHRKFIMVQIPEECPKDSEAYKAGYHNICEIGEERIRRAGNKIKEKNPSVADSLDTGFRVLKLDSSNMEDVYYNPSKYTPDLFNSLEDNIKKDRTDEDLLFQVMLELGIMLDSKIDEKTISGKKVFVVTSEDKTLVCCFDKNVTNDVVTEIAKSKPDYAVFRDSSMSSDSVAINFEQIFKTYSPSTTRKVL